MTSRCFQQYSAFRVLSCSRLAALHARRFSLYLSWFLSLHRFCRALTFSLFSTHSFRFPRFTLSLLLRYHALCWSRTLSLLFWYHLRHLSRWRSFFASSSLCIDKQTNKQKKSQSLFFTRHPCVLGPTTQGPSRVRVPSLPKEAFRMAINVRAALVTSPSS